MAARDLVSSSSRAGRNAGPVAGRYRSLFVIGRGGMGTVEAALELHGGGDGDSGGDSGGDGGAGKSENAPAGGAAYERVVALKRLLPDAARDKRRVEMFLREAKLAKLLDHPNVVRAFDYGEIEGELFFAMEYVEGQPLSRVLRALADANGELGPSLTAHVLAEVCEGLHAAHELRGDDGQPLSLVHRDVSPQNVMLGYDGQVRLLDFGVAKIEAESVTKTGEVKGKTAYMSPEQAMGDVIDRRSDLFGIGAVLFECLALRRMWGDGTDMDVIRKLALEQPPRLEPTVPSAPPELCAIYMRLVARDAKERPATAHDVAEELRKLVPQGREEAARALRKLLMTHFGEQAEEQRARLTHSLEEVAPEQARELRESVIPEPATTPSTRSIPRARSSMASVADATGANPVSNGASGVEDDGDGEGERARGGGGERGGDRERELRSRGVDGGASAARGLAPWTWVIAAAVIIGGVGLWRATNGDGAGSKADVGAGASGASAGAVPGPGASASAGAVPGGSAAVVAVPPASAGAALTPPASAAGSARSPSSAAGTTAVAGGSATSTSARTIATAATATAPSTGAPRTTAVAPTATPSSKPSTPSTSGALSAKPPVVTPTATPPKPPPDVDDHPF